MTVFFDPRLQVWRYNVTRQGVRHQGYCRLADGSPAKNKREATACEAAALQRIAIAPKIPAAGALTIAQAAAALRPAWERQARAPHIKGRVKEILRYFGPAKAMAEISQADVDDYIQFCYAQPIRVWRGGPAKDPLAPAHAHLWADTGRRRTPATVNLYLEILRQIVSRAAKTIDPITRELALKNPPNVPKQRTPKRKARPAPDAVITQVLGEAPPHLYDAALLALCFGFRRGEAFGLKRRNIDHDARGVRLYAEDVKDDEDVFLAASDFAWDLLMQLDEQAEDRGQAHLVTYRQTRKTAEDQAAEPWRPIKSPKRAWRRIMDLVEAKHGARYRFHDLRAAFITQVALNASPAAAQAAARHSEYRTTEGYVEVADAIRRSAAEAATDRPSLRAIKRPVSKSVSKNRA